MHRRFVLVRDEDVPGISGTGKIVEGVIWSDGTVAYRWISDMATTVIADNLDTVLTLHGHDGKTRLEWVDWEAPE